MFAPKLGHPAPIRVGILGCAKIARRSVAPALRKMPDLFNLIAVASREAATAQAFAAEFDCEPIRGYEALLARADIDAVYVPLPTGLHPSWIGAAIAAGKHVYAEKSFAPTAAHAHELVAAARLRQVALMEGYMFLHHRQYAVVSDWLRDGAIGEIRHFHGCFGFPPLPAGDFRYDEVLGGGVLMDAAGYPLRAALSLLGSRLEVNASTVAYDLERGTSLWGSAFLCDGAGVGASIAFGFANFYQCGFEVWGSHGKISARRAYTPSPTFSPKLILEAQDHTSEVDVEPDDHFVGAWRAFHQAISTPVARDRHYHDILEQSSALDRIRELAVRVPGGQA
jgi:dTDP-3,4-didehydro-2,6-dideoxy-alpha-D-glucose 3-reductase